MIAKQAMEHDVAELCELYAVSTSGYYAWARHTPGKRQQNDEELGRRIQAIYSDSRKTYGRPRVMKALRKAGVRCGKNRVARLMRQNGLKGAQKARFRPRTTDSRHMTCRSVRTDSQHSHRLSVSTMSGSVTSRTFQPWKAGCIWRPSWT